MNTIHYKLELLPRNFVEFNHARMEHAMRYEWPWINESISKSFIDRLRLLLPENTSHTWDDDVEDYTSNVDWGSNLRIYKNLDNQPQVEGISFHYSPHDDKLEILEQLVRLASEENCLIYVEESKEVLEPNMDLILSDLEKSHAMRFAYNTESAL